jgi:hypothetical protein
MSKRQPLTVEQLAMLVNKHFFLSMALRAGSAARAVALSASAGGVHGPALGNVAFAGQHCGRWCE